jgi:cation:H+ antiporter
VSTIAAIRGDIGLALGNIVGSNIVNIFMVLPVGILLGKLRIGTTKTQRNAIILFVTTALFIITQLIPHGNFPFGLYLIILAIFLTIAEYTWAIFGRSHEDMQKMKNIKKEKFTYGNLQLWYLLS